MTVGLLSYQVADLCLGKPALRSLSVTATVADGLSALKSSDDTYISVWSCDHFSSVKQTQQCCRCVGKICMVDIICYLCKDENTLSSPSSALNCSVSSVLLSKSPGQIRHIEPSSSLLQAIHLILDGAQNLVVPIKTNSRRKKLPSSPTDHKGREFCWLTQEDVVRFLLSSIGFFSHIPAMSIESLGIISTEFDSIAYHSPASSARGAIANSLADQTSVAVVDDHGSLIGEISPYTLAYCDHTVVAAVATLSAGDLMAYIDCGGPPEDLLRVVKTRLKERKLDGMLEEFSFCSNIRSNSLSSSSDEDDETPSTASTTLRRSSGRYGSRSSFYSARMVRKSEAIVCHPGSSLVAVMIQAISHRVNYVWVIEEDYSLAGIVTFSNMLEVFSEELESMF